MISILDDLPYPWKVPEAEQLFEKLCKVYPRPQSAVLIAEQAGLDAGMLDTGKGPRFIWKDILDQAARDGLTRQLVQQAHDKLNIRSPVRPFLADLLANRAGMLQRPTRRGSRRSTAPAISVCTITKRTRPQIDQMIRLLMKQTISGFEYLIIDGYYHVRKDYIAKLIEQLAPPFRVRHLPPKPSRWDHIRPALSNALNTGLIWAEGRLIVELDDCCIGMPSDLLAKHSEWSIKGFAVSGSWTIDGPSDERQDRYSVATQVGPGLFYGGNRSFPLQKAIEVNGYEESLDGEQGQNDVVLAFMLSKVDVRFMYDPNIRVEFDSGLHTLTQLSPDPRKIKWGKEAWAVFPKKKMMSDGTPHYANEWLADQIVRNGRATPKGNHFQLRKLRQIPPRLYHALDSVQAKLAAYVDPDPYDWRDGEEISKMAGGEFVHSRDADFIITENPVRYAALSNDLNQIVVVTPSTLERVTRSPFRREQIELNVPATGVYLSPRTGQLILLFRSARVYGADLISVEDLGESEDVVQAVCISQSEQYLAAGGWDRAVHVWDFGTRRLRWSFKNLCNSITTLAFLEDEKHLMAGTSDGQIYTLNIENGEHICIHSVFDDIVSAIFPFTMDNKALVLSASYEGSLAIFDPVSCESSLMPSEHTDGLRNVYVTPCGGYAATAGSRGEIRVWDLRQRSLLQTLLLREPALAVKIVLECHQLVAITSIGNLVTWRLNPRL